MISGASNRDLVIAEARADIMLKLDNTSTYESWLIIDTYIEQLEKALIDIREYINNTTTMIVVGKPMKLSEETSGKDILQIIDKVLGDEK